MTKEKILEEIRRLAEANGGVPPGRRALESETGIRENDWCGVYWVKWSAAVREAGYEPNKITVAYPKDKLLEMLALLTRTLGHFPTFAELRLKTNTEEGFPTGKTFGRLGSKPEIIAQLLAFCRRNQGFGDVETICKETLVSLPIEAQSDVDSSEGDGFVYLLKSGRHYKIGRTNDEDRRERELAYQTVEKTSRIHSIRTDDPSGIEAYWHRRFAKKRIRQDGEWFALDAKDVAAFRRRTKFM